jgi:DNA processing protein
MKGALTAGGTVVGVLGCGADVVYPVSNRWLYADTEQYGCILSEFPPGTAPLGRNFPRRNRIISGLSCGVLVVEAPEKSGALITARLSADQGRDVFVVPANIDVESARGSNALMRDGAIPVSSGWDILSEYQYQFPGKVRHRRTAVTLTANAEELSQEREQPALVAQEPAKEREKKPQKRLPRKKVIDNPEKSAYSDFKKTQTALTADEQTIVDALRDGQKLVDDVIAESGRAPGVILASLTLLEVKGVVRRLPGRFIQLTGK